MTNIQSLLDQGAADHRAARFHQAEVAYRRVLAQQPNHPQALHLLGMIAHEAGQTVPAIELIRRAIEISPDDPGFHNNLGTIYEDAGELNQAVACLTEAIRLRSDYAIAYNNLGEVHKARGDVGQALTAYRRALEHDPDFFQARSNLLMVLNYDPNASEEDIFQQHCLWGRLKQQQTTALLPPGNTPDPNRKVRVGYVSPDFRRHAVARFFDPILTHHDRSRFEVYLYAEVPGQDETTKQFQMKADGWRKTVGRSAVEVAGKVRDDQIDILVDLAGHTRHNRLDVFALRPAPVQATYLGYSNTTGLETIDYRISDGVVDPPGRKSWTTEKVVRLPCSFGCFTPPHEAPVVAPPPVLKRAQITFGSHHPPIKLSPPVLRLWASVLDVVPNSRLLFMRNSLTESMAKTIRQRAEAAGIASDRMVVRCPSEHETSYLPIFAEIDIVLDCFPFTGHTMTCESLWMGVPVVTLLGDRPVNRLSASSLTTLGLEELIANSPEQYVEIAAGLAADTNRLQVLRTTLRQKMRGTLMDGQRFTRQLEELLMGLWRSWIDAQDAR